MDQNFSYFGDQFLQRGRLGVHVGIEITARILNVRFRVVQRFQAFKLGEIKANKRDHARWC